MSEGIYTVWGGGRCQIHSSGAGINHFVSLYGVVRSGCRYFGLKKDITAHRKPRGTHRHTTYSTEEVSLEAILVLISLTGAALGFNDEDDKFSTVLWLTVCNLS